MTSDQKNNKWFKYGCGCFLFIIIIFFTCETIWGPFLWPDERLSDFLVAVEDADYQRVSEMIKQGEDVNQQSCRGSTALLKAINCDNQKKGMEIVKLLLDHGAKIDFKNSRGWTPLATAADHATPEMVKLLLARGANINLEAPLCDALTDVQRQDGWKIALILIEHGANVNLAGYKGVTPLMRAVYWPNGLEIVNFLIQKGANVNAKNDEGDTPLINASRRSSTAVESTLEIMKLLISHGADVNATNQKGHNALIESALYGSDSSSDRLQIMKLLIEKGINVNTLLKTGFLRRETALDIVTAENAPAEIIDFLRSHGAKTSAEIKDKK